MSQVNPGATARPKSALALWMTIGARRIDWGVVSATGRTSGCESLGSLDAVESGQPCSLGDMILALALLPENWAAGHAGAGLDVYIADRWLAEAVLPWNSALVSSGREGYARAQLCQAGFDLSPSDVIRLDDVSFGKPRLAVAYPADLLAALTRGAGRWGVPLASASPVSVAAWNLARDRLQPKPQALVLLDEDDIVLVWGGQPETSNRSGAHVADLHLRTRCADLSPYDDLRKSWQRICLRQPQWERLDRVVLLTGCADAGEAAGVPPPLVVPDLADDSSAPASRAAPIARLLAMKGKHPAHVALDAIAPAHSIGLRSGVLLAVAVIVVLFQGLRIMQTAEAVTAIETEVETLSRPEPARTAAPAWTREEANRIRAINAAIRELNLPVSALLRSIAPPRDIRVAVLSVETSGEAAKARSGLRIVAQTPSSTEMARYVGFVAERKPFVGAYLVRHESIDEAGQQFIRFTVEALWND